MVTQNKLVYEFHVFVEVFVKCSLSLEGHNINNLPPLAAMARFIYKIILYFI